jgi:argininosuccinate lyase
LTAIEISLVGHSELLPTWTIENLTFPCAHRFFIESQEYAFASVVSSWHPGWRISARNSNETLFRITDAIFDVLGVEKSVRSRVSYGGTAPVNVRAQARRWLAKLKREARKNPS